MSNIDNILEKYFEGISSAEDEKALKKYFQSGNIQPQHEMYKPLFAAFGGEKQITAPPFGIPAVTEHKNTSRKLWISIASTAAVILLVITLFPFKNRNRTQAGDYLVFINGREITDPHSAQQYADKMFMQADEIIRASYKPFVEANIIQKEMNADRIFNDLSQKINYIESIMQ